MSECCVAVVYTSFPPPFSLLPRLLRYGPNSLDVPVKPYHVLLIEEVLHPFYIFEVLTVIFWMMDDYYYYAGEEVGSGEELGGGRGGGGGVELYINIKCRCVFFLTSFISNLFSPSFFPSLLPFFLSPPLSPPLPLPPLSLSLPSPHTGAVLFISTVSILISLFQTRRHLQQLHDLVALSCTVNILRDGMGEGKGIGRGKREKEGGSSYQRRSGGMGCCKELFFYLLIFLQRCVVCQVSLLSREMCWWSRPLG